MQRGIKLDALASLHELAVRHATDEQRAKLTQITGAVAPSQGPLGEPLGYKQPEHDVFTDEATAILFERAFAELAELRAMVRGLAELNSAGPIPKGQNLKGLNLSNPGPLSEGSGTGGGSPRRIGRPTENRGEPGRAQELPSGWPSAEGSRSRAHLTTTQNWYTLPSGEQIGVNEATVTFRARDLTDKELRTVYNAVRGHVGGKGTKGIEDEDVNLWELVQDLGGPPREHGSKGRFWETVQARWNREHPDEEPYTTPNGVKRRYESILKRLQPPRKG